LSYCWLNYYLNFTIDNLVKGNKNLNDFAKNNKKIQKQKNVNKIRQKLEFIYETKFIDFCLK